MIRSIPLSLAAALLLAPVTAAHADGERMQVTGEVIDTWCYFSGVMGGPDAVVGTSHHTCALWCAAGGIPVGLLTEDGTVYMVVKWQGDADVAGEPTILTVQSHVLTADGMHYERDGIHYLLVEEITADAGIVNETHEIFGPIPGFAIPDPNG